MGSAVAPIAARRDFYEHVVFADIDETKARRVAERYGSHGKYSAARLDATDPAAVTEAIRGHECDVILNAADPRFVMSNFRGALDAGATYLDMAMSLSEPHPERPHEETGKKLGDDQFSMSELWEDRGTLALVGIGIEPGAADVFARYAADHLFSEIDVVYVHHVVDNEQTWKDDGAQAIVWQTAINPVIALELLAGGGWTGTGVLGPEAFDAVPFMDLLNEYGSPWGMVEMTPGSG